MFETIDNKVFWKIWQMFDGTRNTLLCGVQYVSLSLDLGSWEQWKDFSTSFTFLSVDPWVDRDILKLLHFTGVFTPIVLELVLLSGNTIQHCFISLESRGVIDYIVSVTGNFLRKNAQKLIK